MKICYYGNQLGFISGSRKHVLGLAKRFMAEGHEVTVVTKGRDQRVTVLEGVRYEAVSLERRETLASYFVEFPARSLLYFVRHSDFDIIHSMASYHLFALQARLVGAVARTPVVYGVVSPASRAINLLGFPRLICASRSIKEHLGERAVFIPHSLDLASFAAGTRYEYEQDERFTVGSMGAPHARRGFEYLIRAIPLVLERYPHTQFVLAIENPEVGYQPMLQRRLRELRDLIARLGVARNVKLVGEVDVPRFLNSLDVFVYAVQTTKGMIDIPPTVLECLAAGCALVTTAKGGIPEVIDHRENGLLVSADEASNPQAYADKIVELIEDDALRSSLRENARRSAEPYDVSRIAPQVMAVYEEVLSGRGR
jgi:glycosyltransferase involved in cell wall biosynthesis